jgi:ATP-binding cassette subfamily B protein
VPQNGFLFSTTLLENIGFSEDDVDNDRVERSAVMTAVDEDIKKFPDRYKTEIGERGVRLSGGQKQRVAIARMIYKNAPVHILDDSLSAVDTKTERLILKNMRKKHAGASGKDVTTIIISHRLSAVMNADEIIILDEGRITERGSHAELLRSGGLYAKLWDMQSGESGRSEPVTDDGKVKTEMLEVLLSEETDAESTEAKEEGV